MAENNSNGSGFMGKLWDTVSGFFEVGFGKVWWGFVDTFESIAERLNNKTHDLLQGIENRLWFPQVKAWRDRGWIDEETEKELYTLTDLNFPFNAVAFMLITVSMLLTVTKQLMQVAGGDIRRRLFAKYRSEDIRAEAVIPAYLLDPKKEAAIRKVLEDTGYPEEQIDLLFLTIKRSYDESSVRDLYLRGVLSEDQMFERMRNLGYDDKRIEEFIQSWPVIPGAGDLFHLVAKEAFEPDIIKHYGYDEEFPVDQIKWLKMQGISEDWAKKYWYAHWQTPSIQAGYDMLHRNIIDRKELNDLFRTIEIPPFWRDKLTKIAFLPFTRVDTRRMHKAGVLNTEELINAYMDVGYDLEKATKMTEFTIQYNADSGKKLTKAQVVNGFDEYLLTYDEAKTMLTTIKYTEDQADFILTFVEYERAKKYNATVVKTIKKRFLLSLITEAQTVDKLNALNLPGEKVTILLDQWQLDKYDNLKIPSKGDLNTFLDNKIIDDTTYREEMFRLGYSHKHIDWYVRAKGMKRQNG